MKSPASILIPAPPDPRAWRVDAPFGRLLRRALEFFDHAAPNWECTACVRDPSGVFRPAADLEKRLKIVTDPRDAFGRAVRQAAHGVVVCFPVGAGYPIKEAEMLAAKIAAGFDAVAGSRFLRGESIIQGPRWSPQVLKERAAAACGALTHPAGLSDAGSGFAAFRREALMRILESGRPVPEGTAGLLAAAARLKQKITQAGIMWNPRER